MISFIMLVKYCREVFAVEYSFHGSNVSVVNIILSSSNQLLLMNSFFMFYFRIHHSPLLLICTEVPIFRTYQVTNASS